MDKLLAPLLTAGDDVERQKHLHELLSLRAAPLIRGALLRRLGFYVSARGANENNQDAEDLYQEAMMRILQGLNQLQPSAGTDIENFELYVSRLASNICTDFLRKKSPARTRLKYRLRDLLKRHRDLASWEHNGEVLCGFTVWRNTAKSALSDEGFEEIETKLDDFQSLHFTDEDIRHASVSQIVTELFDWIGGPIEIDLLVRIMAYLLDVRDQQIDSLDDPSAGSHDGDFRSHAQSAEFHLEANELLTRLWRAVIQMPAEQRDSFAFAFEDAAGQDLFTVLIAAEVVTWNELAIGMNRSVDEVVRLRLRMPMDNAQLAHELRASRSNVYKWRFRAIQRLRADLER